MEVRNREIVIVKVWHVIGWEEVSELGVPRNCLSATHSGLVRLQYLEQAGCGVMVP